MEEGVYDRLRVISEMYWDVQEMRDANNNRKRAGEVLGLPDVTDAMDLIEQGTEKLSRAMVIELRQCAPATILDWCAESPGVGEHLLARLLGVIGEPYYAYPHRWEGTGRGERTLVEDAPFLRNLDKLWAYCGVGDPSRKRRKGMSAEDAVAVGNPRAKTILYLMAVSCLKKPGSRYEIVYRKYREEVAGHSGKCDEGSWPSACSTTHKLHNADCQNRKVPPAKPNGCGIGAHREWGEVGSPWRPGHIHGAALRKVAKEILRDLWEADRADYIANT